MAVLGTPKGSVKLLRTVKKGVSPRKIGGFTIFHHVSPKKLGIESIFIKLGEG